MYACTDIDPEKQSHMEIQAHRGRVSNTDTDRNSKHRDLIKQVLPPERKGSSSDKPIHHAALQVSLQFVIPQDKGAAHLQ